MEIVSSRTRTKYQQIDTARKTGFVHGYQRQGKDEIFGLAEFVHGYQRQRI